MSSPFAHWRANFYTGLAVVLPAVISLAVVKWLFGTISNVTDPLLFFLPRRWTHQPNGGPMYWWWSIFAIVFAVALISAIGRSARHYIGKKLIDLIDLVLLRVPLLNKIYGAIKQVNDAFTSSNKSSFKQVVLIRFPRDGMYSVGFITGEQHEEVQHKTREDIVCVFVPKAPNPTTGFLVLVPKEDVILLEMSVADGIKYVISFGSVSLPYTPPEERIASMKAAIASFVPSMPNAPSKS